MTRTQKLRRISHTTRRPGAWRPAPTPARRSLRAQALPPATRRGLSPERHRAPVPLRRRSAHLRLVAVNPRPLRGRPVSAPPALRLVRGFAPAALALPHSSRPVPGRREEHVSGRAGQLVFVLAMAAVGLAALATSVGQLLSRGM